MNILITGGAGFIGVNTAKYFLNNGHNIWIYDKFSRKGSSKNFTLLKSQYPKVTLVKADIRDFESLQKNVIGKDIVFHFAGQVAVTTSVQNPRLDFEINALGTFNVLEAVRLKNPKAILIYSSTNKVYGGMENEKIIENKTRYGYKNLPFGISEKYPLDFHSPYGCSKGAADQYVRDYARIYDLSTIVFRQSCIYGPHQFGVEDQGWIAWFIIALILGRDISIYGNGKQVRDVLFIDDLVHAYALAIEHIRTTKGQIYNIGGGPNNSIAVWQEFGPLLEKKFNKKIKVASRDWRPGDQLVYISDIRKAKKDFQWVPKVNLENGVEEVITWSKQHSKLLDSVVK